MPVVLRSAVEAYMQPIYPESSGAQPHRSGGSPPPRVHLAGDCRPQRIDLVGWSRANERCEMGIPRAVRARTGNHEPGIAAAVVEHGDRLVCKAIGKRSWIGLHPGERPALEDDICIFTRCRRRAYRGRLPIKCGMWTCCQSLREFPTRAGVAGESLHPCAKGHHRNATWQIICIHIKMVTNPLDGARATASTRDGSF